MRLLYKSKLGEVKTKQEWLLWGEDFYNKICHYETRVKRPKNIWERIVKVLKLEEVGYLDEGYSQYPELNENNEREWV